MRSLPKLFENNRAWAESVEREDPHFFEELAREQHPECLWIGCSDSRVPPNQVVGLKPGEAFVHRNVANIVAHADLNGLSVMQFAVEVLKVKHVIVCGHYGCGGVGAVLKGERHGLVDEWLGHVHSVLAKHEAQLASAGDTAKRHQRLCELNVVEQVVNASKTTVVRDAWSRGQPLTLHGWIYGLSDGRLRDLSVTSDDAEQLAELYAEAVQPR